MWNVIGLQFGTGSLSLVLYVLATVSQGIRLFNRQRLTRALVLGFGFIAILLHAYLLYRWIDIGVGQNLSFFNMLSMVSWTIALIVFLSMLRKPMDDLVLLIFPLAAMSIVLVGLFPQQNIVDTKANMGQLLHLLLSIVAFSVMCTAGIQAIFLAIQDSLLRSKKAIYWQLKLPAIETMETLLFQIILVGFVLLSLVIFSSVLFFHTLFNPKAVHETILALGSWVAFAILLWGRYHFGWRGRSAIRWTLVGVMLLVLSYFGSHYLVEFIITG